MCRPLETCASFCRGGDVFLGLAQSPEGRPQTGWARLWVFTHNGGGLAARLEGGGGRGGCRQGGSGREDLEQAGAEPQQSASTCPSRSQHTSFSTSHSLHLLVTKAQAFMLPITLWGVEQNPRSPAACLPGGLPLRGQLLLWAHTCVHVVCAHCDALQRHLGRNRCQSIPRRSPLLTLLDNKRALRRNR